MAHESAVADFSSLETTATCAGCGKSLNLLENHVLLTLKVQRQVVESVDAALVGAKTNDSGEIVELAEIDDEEADTSRYYMGTRSGAADHVVVHNDECAISFIQDHKNLGSGDKPRLKLLRDDPHADLRSA